MKKQIFMEEWENIPNYEEYQVSTLGRVKRLAYYKNVCVVETNNTVKKES